MYEIFEELLKERGLKPIDVSRATGISSSTLTDWKMGRSVPKRDKMQKIATFLNVSAEYLDTGIEKDDDDELNTPKTRKRVAKRLDKALNMNKISANDLASASGVAKSLINHYLSAEHIPSEENAKRLSSVLSVNHLWLMGFDAPMHPSETDADLSDIINMYKGLSDLGKSKVYERIQELVTLEKIQSQSNAQQPDAYVVHADAIRQVNAIEESRNKKHRKTIS